GRFQPSFIPPACGLMNSPESFDPRDVRCSARRLERSATCRPTAYPNAAPISWSDVQWPRSSVRPRPIAPAMAQMTGSTTPIENRLVRNSAQDPTIAMCPPGSECFPQSNEPGIANLYWSPSVAGGATTSGTLGSGRGAAAPGEAHKVRTTLLAH